MDHSPDVDNTAFQLSLGSQTLLEMNEQNRDGAYLLQTPLAAKPYAVFHADLADRYPACVVRCGGCRTGGGYGAEYLRCGRSV